MAATAPRPRTHKATARYLGADGLPMGALWVLAETSDRDTAQKALGMSWDAVASACSERLAAKSAAVALELGPGDGDGPTEARLLRPVAQHKAQPLIPL